MLYTARKLARKVVFRIDDSINYNLQQPCKKVYKQIGGQDRQWSLVVGRRFNTDEEVLDFLEANGWTII